MCPCTRLWNGPQAAGQDQIAFCGPFQSLVHGHMTPEQFCETQVCGQMPEVSGLLLWPSHPCEDEVLPGQAFRVVPPTPWGLIIIVSIVIVVFGVIVVPCVTCSSA